MSGFRMKKDGQKDAGYSPAAFPDRERNPDRR